MPFTSPSWLSWFSALDPIILARIQFAFTVSFHIIFPAFTIGLASWLAVLEALWLKTNKMVYQTLYQFWIKIFAVAFGMGVVSGLVLSYQFGTNWSRFSDKVGNVLGPLLSFEILTAFFLESSFLGIMLFGWNKVTKKMHFLSTLIVALGTVISTFWILSANSWMHTPRGFRIDEVTGVFFPLNWLEIVFNPSFIPRLLHMLTAAYLTTSFVVGAVAAYYLLQKRHLEFSKMMLSMSLLMAIVATPVQILIGDYHGLNTFKHQPVKVAAIEGIWENEKGAPLRLFGWPDEVHETTKYSLAIPKMASLILTHSFTGEIKGLKNWPADQRPPVAIVFWSFRIMVGIGLLMLATGIMAVYLYCKRNIFNNALFLKWCVLMAPSGFVATLAGWFVAEVGRQPYVVYGLLKTTQAASPLPSHHLLFSLSAFMGVYLFIFSAGIYYILKLIQKGPKHLHVEDGFKAHGLESLPLIQKDEQ